MVNWNCIGFQRTTFSSVVMVTTFWLVGCGSQEEEPELIPVAGNITLDGNPLPKVGISYRPDASKGNTAPYQPGGTASDDGEYELVAAAKKGAPPGWYKVVVFPYSPPPYGGAPKVAPPPFNKKYSDPATTDLSVEVKDGAPPGAYDLQLTK